MGIALKLAKHKVSHIGAGDLDARVGADVADFVVIGERAVDEAGDSDNHPISVTGPNEINTLDAIGDHLRREQFEQETKDVINRLRLIVRIAHTRPGEGDQPLDIVQLHSVENVLNSDRLQIFGRTGYLPNNIQNGLTFGNYFRDFGWLSYITR